MKAIYKLIGGALGSAILLTNDVAFAYGYAEGDCPPNASSVPELDPTTMAGALALIFAAAVVIHGARRRS